MGQNQKPTSVPLWQFPVMEILPWLVVKILAIALNTARGTPGCLRARAKHGVNRVKGLKVGEEIGPGSFGSSLALSTNGNTALIGGNSDNTCTGAAWVFARSGETWSQQGPKLTAHGEINNGLFGINVALSGDGNTALIGATNEQIGDSVGVGAAYAFKRFDIGMWLQAGKRLDRKRGER